MARAARPLDERTRRRSRTSPPATSKSDRAPTGAASKPGCGRRLTATLLIITRDTTERRSAKARIEYLAYYDTLTGLPNRQLFVREMSRAIRPPSRPGTLIALLYLDLDRFKRINDNLGHSVGDALLKAVARRLRADASGRRDLVRPSERQQPARVAAASRAWAAMSSWCC